MRTCLSEEIFFHCPERKRRAGVRRCRLLWGSGVGLVELFCFKRAGNSMSVATKVAALELGIKKFYQSRRAGKL